MLNFQENTSSSIDNPRHVASKERITMMAEGAGELVGMPPIDSDSQSAADIFNNAGIAEEVRSLESKSLKEIMNQDKENSTPNMPRIIVTEPDDLLVDEQGSPIRKQKLLLQFDSVGK